MSLKEKKLPAVTLELARRQVARILNQLQLLQSSLNVVADEAIYLARQLGIQFPQPGFPQPPPTEKAEKPDQESSKASSI
jgi:hypothetical protein